jgi:hypothetical protein
MADDERVAVVEPAYEARDAIFEAIRTGALTGAGGFLMSAVQNTVQKQNVGAMGVFTKYGGTTAIFGIRASIRCDE